MKFFKEAVYKVGNCTLYSDNDKILKKDDVFVLNKDIKIHKEQLKRLIDDKKIIYLKDNEENTKVDDIPKDTSILDNETDSLIKDKSKK